MTAPPVRDPRGVRLKLLGGPGAAALILAAGL